MSDTRTLASAELLERLGNPEPKIAVAAARELACRKESTVGARILEILRTTEDGAVRNAMAIALSVLRDSRGFDPIVELLKDDRTRSNRGTLLHALGGYDCAPVLGMLVDFVIHRNFEVSRQALSLIHGVDTTLDTTTWIACLDRVKDALDRTAPERRPLLEELLSLFEQEDE